MSRKSNIWRKKLTVISRELSNSLFWFIGKPFSVTLPIGGETLSKHRFGVSYKTQSSLIGVVMQDLDRNPDLVLKEILEMFFKNFPSATISCNLLTHQISHQKRIIADKRKPSSILEIQTHA